MAQVWEQGTSPRLRSPGDFLLPPKAAQVPSSPWVGRQEVGKALGHWEGELVARNGDGDTGDSLASSTKPLLNGSPALAWSLCLGCTPFPRVGGQDPKEPQTEPQHHPPPSQGLSSAPFQDWGAHQKLHEAEAPLMPKGALGSAVLGWAGGSWHTNTPS